jgi:AcrR family transcriptional regulator
LGIAERREREKEHLRTAILEAARDILSAEGLDRLSMRAIAERIEYSPATIYLYFKDKDELIGQVIREGFARLAEYTATELARLAPGARAADRFRAQGRAYARFALENTAYFRIMFELPSVARIDCDALAGGDKTGIEDAVLEVTRASLAGEIRTDDPLRTTLIGWALVHGVTSLFLAGHLVEVVRTGDEFMELVDAAMRQMHEGWRGGDIPGESGTP